MGGGLVYLRLRRSGLGLRLGGDRRLRGGERRLDLLPLRDLRYLRDETKRRNKLYIYHNHSRVSLGGLYSGLFDYNQIYFKSY